MNLLARRSAGPLAVVLAAAVFLGSAWAQSGKPGSTAAAAPVAATTGAKAASSASARVSPYHTQKMTHKAQELYVTAWGVDKLKVSYTSSGNLIRFSYRVSNPELAKALANKTATPYLVGQRAHAVLQVPTMDQVGQLRQSAAAPQVGMEYWMVFSNKGNLVRPGDRVDVLIGSFHADGLMVE